MTQPEESRGKTAATDAVLFSDEERAMLNEPAGPDEAVEGDDEEGLAAPVAGEVPGGEPLRP